MKRTLLLAAIIAIVVVVLSSATSTPAAPPDQPPAPTSTIGSIDGPAHVGSTTTTSLPVCPHRTLAPCRPACSLEEPCVCPDGQLAVNDRCPRPVDFPDEPTVDDATPPTLPPATLPPTL